MARKQLDEAVSHLPPQTISIHLGQLHHPTLLSLIDIDHSSFHPLLNWMSTPTLYLGHPGYPMPDDELLPCLLEWLVPPLKSGDESLDGPKAMQNSLSNLVI
jgi:hypothetical protein